MLKLHWFNCMEKTFWIFGKWRRERGRLEFPPYRTLASSEYFRDQHKPSVGSLDFPVTEFSSPLCIPSIFPVTLYGLGVPALVSVAYSKKLWSDTKDIFPEAWWTMYNYHALFLIVQTTICYLMGWKNRIGSKSLFSQAGPDLFYLFNEASSQIHFLRFSLVVILLSTWNDRKPACVLLFKLHWP